MPIVEQTTWSFLRGDTSAEDFEKFVYTNEFIEALVCLRTCDCITWGQKQTIPLGFDTVDLFNSFDVLKERNPWLELVRCKMCGQAWYLATDTVDDDYHLMRLTDEQVNEISSIDKWPTLFDDFQNVWPDADYPATSN